MDFFVLKILTIDNLFIHFALFIYFFPSKAGNPLLVDLFPTRAACSQMAAELLYRAELMILRPTSASQMLRECSFTSVTVAVKMSAG